MMIIILQVKMKNICWYKLLQYDNIQLFFDSKLNTFRFWTIGWTNKTFKVILGNDNGHFSQLPDTL